VKPVEWVRRLNGWLEHIARERDAVYIDYFSVLAADDRSMRADYTNDGVHPNAAGYAAMKPLVLSAIDKVLGVPA
jgi:lysophospholipase L1-like esterase